MKVIPSAFDERDDRPLHRRRRGSTDLAMATTRDPLFRINDFVFYSPGITNSNLVTTSEGDVVIGAGLAAEGRIHRAKFDLVSRAPVRRIILTQGHLDCVGGTNAFRDATTKVMAHVNSRACQFDDARIKGFRERRNPRFFPAEVRTLNDLDAEMMAAGQASVYTAVEADTLVEDRCRFSLGGVDFEVIALPGGETLDSLAVWLPQHGILFTGNAMGPLFPHMPNLHTIRGDRPRPVGPYLATYDRILGLRPEILVTGHFNPIRGVDFIAEEVARLRDAVRHVERETVHGMNEGRTVHDLKREIRLPPDLQVGEDYGTVIWAVEAIWYGYGGWFEYRSTTELYGMPVHETYREVAALAGAAVLGARALALARDGRALEAIHLAEIAMAAEPEEPQALEAYALAHELLLAAAPSRNRWYQFWLKGELARARQRQQPPSSATEPGNG